VVDNGPLVVDQLKLPSFLVLGVDLNRLGLISAALEKAEIIPDITPTPSRLRAMLIASAQPIEGDGAHESGRGYVSVRGTDTFLAGFDGADLLRFFGEPDLGSNVELPARPLADGMQLETAIAVWRKAHLLVYFDTNADALSLV